MATITLTVNLQSGGSISVSNTVSDANVARAQTAMAALLPGNTNRQLLGIALKRLLDRVAAMTKSYERGQDAIADIPIT